MSAEKPQSQSEELSIKCERCGHTGKPIRKLWCYICAECRIILEYVDPYGPIKIPVDIVEDK